jgi:hypothetical protein
MIRSIVHWYKRQKAADRLFTDKLAVAIFNIIGLVVMAVLYGFAFYYIIIKDIIS